MPLVRIAIPQHFSAARLQAISSAVHDAMLETITIPAADRFQIITRHAPDELVLDPTFLGINRSADASIVDITLRGGRSDDQKRALYARITALAQERASVSPADIMVVLSENTMPDWSFGDGLAQYAPAA